MELKCSGLSALSVTDEEGRWSFDGIPDGVYTIMVNPGFEVIELQGKTSNPDSLKTYEAISREITVQGKNLEGIKLEVKVNEKRNQNQTALTTIALRLAIPTELLRHISCKHHILCSR